MKIKTFHDVWSDAEEEVNEFIKDKVVIDIKISEGACYDDFDKVTKTFNTVLIMYEDKENLLDKESFKSLNYKESDAKDDVSLRNKLEKFKVPSGEVMTVDEFLENIDIGNDFTSYDGSGYWLDKNGIIISSINFKTIPENAVYVYWCNK